MRALVLSVALAACAAVPGAAAAAPSTSWSSKADSVCVVWIAKAKKEFGAPVKPSELYGFAVKAKTLESNEFAELDMIPGRSAAGTAALAAMKADIAEVGAAITAWDGGNRALFVSTLKRYLNDHRAKAAFAAAGARKCG